MNLIVLKIFLVSILVSCSTDQSDADGYTGASDSTAVEEAPSEDAEVEINEAFEQFRSFFENQSWGSQSEQRKEIPFELAREFIYRPNQDDVYFMLDSELEDLSDYEDAAIIASGMYELESGITLFMCHFDTRVSFNYLIGSMLFSYSSEGTFIDYLPFNFNDAIPKAGGELSMAYSSVMEDDMLISQVLDELNVMSRDVDDEERAEKDLSPEVTGAMETETAVTRRSLKLSSNGKFEVVSEKSEETEMSVEYY